MDTELHLLETNRKRLLTQQDWVGIDPSKPVSLRFRSSREKSKIGKRRRTTRGRGAVPRRKDNDEFGNEDHNFEDDAFAQVLGHSVPRQRLDDIRIRIGTDAMTNTYSTQLDQCAQSRASSESMLFDQEEPLAQLRSAKPSVNLELLAATSTFEQADVASRAPSTGEQTQHYGFVRRSVASPSSGASEQKSSTGNPLELQCQPAIITSRMNGSSTHDFRLTHYAYGEERAFGFAFSGSNSTACARGCNASDGHQIGEKKPFSDPDSAGESKMGYVHQLNIDRERLVGVDVSAAHTIVDEGPWKTYLAISDRSSHSDTSIPSRSSVPHYPAKRHNNEAAMDWSQHATQGQGNESRISSSSISASLPALKRGVRKPISAHASDMAIIRRDRPVNAAVQSLDEEERNWQAFVFQGDDKHQGMHDHARKTSPLVPKYSENSSSRCLPLSRAVSSVSPATHESRPRIASGTGYDALESRALTPSTFRNANSLELCGFVEGMTENKQGEKMLGRKVFDGQSHASLQNHASSDIISSRVLSATTRSRILEQHASAVAQHPTSSNRRILCGNSQGSSSGCDILTSDDGALHLVDPNRR